MPLADKERINLEFTGLFAEDPVVPWSDAA
jgi:hypothetical protein